MIPYGRHSVDEGDIQAVVDVLRSDNLTQGSVVPAFEDTLCRVVDVSYAVAVNSATSALHTACLALGVGPGDLVWTSAVTFVASANCGIYCGASVDFVDIDLRIGNMSVAALEAKLKAAALVNMLPKVLIPVHLAGEPCNMVEIYNLVHPYGVRIIEDASHAIGASQKSIAIGACTYSDITVFSFHPVKIITTGEGGGALTNQRDLADAMQLLRSHGITKDPSQMVSEPDGPWYYEQIKLGFNYRMTDIHAALGLSQLKKLSGFIAARRKIARRYDEFLNKNLMELPTWGRDNKSSLHLYVIKVPETYHKRIFQALREQEIMVNLHYMPVYAHPFYAAMGFKRSDFPNAEKYYRCAISIPIYPDLSQVDQDHIISLINQVCMPLT